MKPSEPRACLLARCTVLRVRDREAGAGTIEYIGITVLISVLIAALSAVPWAPQFGPGMEKVICQIFSHVPGGAGSCSAGDPPPTEAELTPECLLSDSSKTRGGSVSVVVVDVGSDVKMQVKKYSDGTSTVTLLEDYSGGASVDAGKVKLGKGTSIKLGVSGKLTYGNGDTWQFSSPEEADKFVKSVEGYTESKWNYVPVIGPMVNERPDDPRITYDEIKGEGKGSADLSLPKLVESGKKDSKGGKGGDGGTGGDDKGSDVSVPKDKSALDVGADVKFGESVVVQHDRGDDADSPDDDTTTYITSMETGAGGRATVGDHGGGANANTKGDVRVKTNSKGEIINITLVNTRNADAGTGEDSDDKNSHVYTTSLDVKNDEQRKTVEQWLANPSNMDPATLLAGPPQPAKGGQTDPFQQLLYERAQFQDEQFEGDLDNRDQGVGGKLFGVGLGYDTKEQDEDSKNVGSYYYGTPDANGVRHRTDNPKC